MLAVKDLRKGLPFLPLHRVLKKAGPWRQTDEQGSHTPGRAYPHGAWFLVTVLV